MTLYDLKRVLNLFPETVWIAGSAAIRPQQAEDIDVFVPRSTKVNWKVAFEQLSLTKIWPKDHLFQSFPEEDYANSDNVLLFRGVSEGIPVHVICSKHSCIYQILDRFDVSCHAWAINGAGQIAKAPWATFPGYTIRTGPHVSPDGSITLNRINEFTDRYQSLTKELLGP